MSTAVKWHDYLSRALFAALCSRCTWLSQYTATDFFSPVAPCSFGIDRSIDSSGFLHGARLGCGSLKTDPLKFFRRFSRSLLPAMAGASCTIIRICIHLPFIITRACAYEIITNYFASAFYSTCCIEISIWECSTRHSIYLLASIQLCDLSFANLTYIYALTKNSWQYFYGDTSITFFKTSFVKVRSILLAHIHARVYVLLSQSFAECARDLCERIGA
ncbi:hypothetical protein PUN28_010573 [Cardiocondyla obscurior]|uniref:Secreted protein n=1 Tax=Cardiocondyla obscurior TaxID=286306 RepID=A0AAW2FM79_9HYME